MNKKLIISVATLGFVWLCTIFFYFGPSDEKLTSLRDQISSKERELTKFFPAAGNDIDIAINSLTSRQTACKNDFAARADKMLNFLPDDWVNIRNAERPGFAVRKKLMELRESLGRKASQRMPLFPSLGFGEEIIEDQEEAQMMVHQLFLVNCVIEKALAAKIHSIVSIEVLPLEESGTKETHFLKKCPVEFKMVCYTKPLDKFLELLLRDEHIVTENLIINIAPQKIEKAQYPLEITMRLFVAWQILQQGMYEKPGVKETKPATVIFAPPGV